MKLLSVSFKSNFVLLTNSNNNFMKHLLTTLLALFITMSISAQSKAEQKAQDRTDEIEQVLSLNKSDKEKVYTILLEKENEIAILRKKHKGDKDALRAEIKKLNPIYNRKLKDFLGGENMKKMHAYFRAKREKSKK